MTPEAISGIVVHTAYQLHKDLGPGLLESVYETVLARMLEERGLDVKRQHPVAFDYCGIHFNDGMKVDLLINDCFVVELKSVEYNSPVHAKQLLTYLRLMGFSIGLLINFGASTFKDGVRRVVNNHKENKDSMLRLNKPV